jgi:hypothetical protein
MKTSESITNISKALVAFGQSMPKVPKDKINPHFKSKYASLSIMIEKATPILAANKLAIVQQIDGDCMTTTLLHESGEYITATAAMPCANPSNPQAMGSAITYARRYAYGSILSLDIDDDDDANAATQTAPPQKQTAPPKPTVAKSATVPKAERVIVSIGDDIYKAIVKALSNDKGTLDQAVEKYNISSDVQKWIKAEVILAKESFEKA